MLDILAFLIFIIAIVLYVYKDRKNVQFNLPIIMRRTNKGKALLDNSVKKRPRFWKTMAIIAVIVAIPAMIFISYFIINNVSMLLTGQKTEAVKVVLPWTEARSEPGVFFVPWYFWVIGIACIIIPHELFHGFMCRLNNIRVKSLGWFFLLFLPGAFVEPDEKQLQKAAPMTKITVYAAGSFANFVVAGLALILSMLLVFAAFTPAGVGAAVIVDSGFPAEKANLTGIIVDINGTPIHSVSDIANALQEIPVGSNITITTKITINATETLHTYNITTIQHPAYNTSHSFIGIAEPYKTVQEPKFKEAAVPINFIAELLMWIFILSFGIGLFNLLPIKPLDGGLIFEEIMKKPFPQRARIITIAVSLILVAMIIISIVGPILLHA